MIAVTFIDELSRAVYYTMLRLKLIFLLFFSLFSLRVPSV